MSEAGEVETLLTDPVGRYSPGPSDLVWCHSPTLCGTLHWGRCGQAEAVGLARRLELTTHPALAGGFDLLMDARAIDAFDAAAFSVFSEYARTRMELWNRRIRKKAVLVPPGPVGALFGGLLPLLGPGYSLRFFTRMEDALVWLDRPELPGVLDEVARITRGVHDLHPVLRGLRDYLQARLEGVTLEDAARALGTAPRTLQRELRRLGTRFSVELTRARLRTACIALELSDDKVEAIARSVGLSGSQLHALFRESFGETPAEYRARRRGG